ncbi:DUF4396 domain-containing protein [Arenicella sp. 4NH20-0111]|uniref:DUF4396 domain-containing protein n=1 Tax=Arenicella sp. 4NH20-0111 TaxID=3127648 RepID=UPI00333FED8B
MEKVFSKEKTSSNSHFNWRDTEIWRQSAWNTAWCLLGCVIGDFGTILWFQLYSPETSTLIVMSLAVINGILSSIALETAILSRQMGLLLGFKTAVGMSLVSMVSMEIAMNLTDFVLVGRAQLVWWAIPPMLIAGFITPWPYNYWRLKKLGKACH